MTPKLLETGAPPYFAVIFSFKLRNVDLSEYYRRSEMLMNKAVRLPGFYGEEAIRLVGRDGLTVSYWRSLEDIQGWRDDVEHEATRRLGIANWYQQYDLRVAEITRAYGLGREQVQGQNTGGDGQLAVIFSSVRTEGDDEAYGQAAEDMASLASERKGFLDLMSLKRDDGYGITISFWSHPADAAAWRADPIHQAIQKKGRDCWYDDYWVRIGRVLRQNKFSR